MPLPIGLGLDALDRRANRFRVAPVQSDLADGGALHAFGNRQRICLELAGFVLDSLAAERGQQVVRVQGESLPLRIVAERCGNLIDLLLERVAILVCQRFSIRTFECGLPFQAGETGRFVISQAQCMFFGLVQRIVDAQLVGLLRHVETDFRHRVAGRIHPARHLLRLLAGHVRHIRNSQARLRECVGRGLKTIVTGNFHRVIRCSASWPSPCSVDTRMSPRCRRCPAVTWRQTQTG